MLAQEIYELLPGGLSTWSTVGMMLEVSGWAIALVFICGAFMGALLMRIAITVARR